MENVRKVRVLENDGKSQLIQIEDEYGTCWTRRSRVHLVGTEYYVTTERHAILMRNALARQQAREAKRAASQKLAREVATAQPKVESEVAA